MQGFFESVPSVMIALHSIFYNNRPLSTSYIESDLLKYQIAAFVCGLVNLMWANHCFFHFKYEDFKK